MVIELLPSFAVVLQPARVPTEEMSTRVFLTGFHKAARRSLAILELSLDRPHIHTRQGVGQVSVSQPGNSHVWTCDVSVMVGLAARSISALTMVFISNIPRNRSASKSSSG
jgi:hypothetical protein